MKKNFVHLRLHSEFSITDGLLHIEDIIKISKKDNQIALAITDLSNLFATIKFYNEAINNGIKPIIGCDVWITNKKERNSPFRLLLLAKNYIGYLQLCKLITKSWLKNLYLGRAEIKISWLKKLNKKKQGNNLISLSGGEYGNININIKNNNINNARKYIKIWKKIFPNSFYIEIQRLKNQKNIEQKLINLANEFNIPIVATQPIQFNKIKDFIIHEIRNCITTGQILSNKNRTKLFNKFYNFKTQNEMINLFNDIPEAIINTIEIAKKCNLILNFDKVSLPKFLNNILFENKLLKKKTIHGLKKRIKFKNKSVYKNRLNFEMKIIIKMGFSGYFLIVSDFVNWAKNHNIIVGPGRGSGASSLIAYLLNITDIDPIKYNLLFERFLNIKRISLPDFDIDLCPKKRNKVIKYIKKRYGKNNVVQIITFGTMTTKSVIRDTGRVLGLNYNFCNNLTKIISNKYSNINEVIKNEPLFKEKIKNDYEVNRIIKLAKKIEGVIRNTGTHAGGILISPKKIINFCPLYLQEKNSDIVSQYDKYDIENIGLIKFDLLGLTTLTIIQKTIKNIKKINKKINIDLLNLPLKDKKTYKLLEKANTIAIFQLESFGMRNILKKIKPKCIEDIIALISLYRPGPLNLITEFCKRKNGKKFKYPDNRIKDILKETYGIMIYQEQVMKIAQIIAGYSLEKADLLRIAISKKNKQEMIKHRNFFIKGSIKNGLTYKKSEKIFNLVEKFAGYGFNKSHATAYSLIAYYTIYLKTYYKTEFMAANLSASMDNTEKIKILLKDSINTCKIKLLPPNINLSKYNFKPIIKDNIKIIRWGLGGIKNLGKNTITEILKTRKKGKFKNFFNFVNRVKKINKRKIEYLIYSGAFDCFKEKRNILKSYINIALKNVQYYKLSINQINLFNNNLFNNQYTNKKYYNVNKYLEKEKKTLGIYLSSHPIKYYKKELEKLKLIKIIDIYKYINKKILISGIIINNKVKFINNKKKYIITLDDNSNIIDIIININLYKNNKKKIKIGKLIIIKLIIIKKNFCKYFIKNIIKIMNLEYIRKKYGKFIIINILKKISYKKLKNFLSPFIKNRGLNCIINYINNKKFILKNTKILPCEKLKKYLFNIYYKNDFYILY